MFVLQRRWTGRKSFHEAVYGGIGGYCTLIPIFLYTLSRYLYLACVPTQHPLLAPHYLCKYVNVNKMDYLTCVKKSITLHIYIFLHIYLTHITLHIASAGVSQYLRDLEGLDCPLYAEGVPECLVSPRPVEDVRQVGHPPSISYGLQSLALLKGVYTKLP
jgi:hypothetical protein